MESAYYVPGTTLGTGDTTVNEIKITGPRSLHSCEHGEVRKEENLKVTEHLSNTTLHLLHGVFITS